MKNMKKLLALALVIVSVFAIALPALAYDPITLYVKPGKNPRTAGYVTDSFTCECTLAGSGDTVRVFLDTPFICFVGWNTQLAQGFHLRPWFLPFLPDVHTQSSTQPFLQLHEQTFHLWIGY